MQAQQIVTGEYFYDSDPGLGLGTVFSVTPGSTVNQTIAIPTTGLSAGFHNLFIRVKNNLGVWSHYEGRMLYILPTEIPVTETIVQGEYFVDTDPGIGNATVFSLGGTAQINTAINVNTTSLTPGFHNLFIRVKNNLGVWSHYEGRMFYILPNEPVTSETLVSGEYFVDTDPGIGNGSTFTLGGTSQVNTALNISTTSLTPGFHNLFIRVKNNLGVWSHYEGRMFYILPSESAITENIVSGEWFIDTDPGIGNATPFTTASAAQINTVLNLTTSTLSGGTHRLYIRVKNNLGVWSHYEGREFYICANPLAQSVVTGNTTFCSGSTISLSGSTVPYATSYLWQGPNGYSSSGLNLNITNATTAMSGTYVLSAIRPGGTECDTSQTSITIDVLPVISSTNPQTICQGGSYTINGNTYTTAGTYTNVLVSASGCDSTVSTILTVNTSYNFNNPQTICPGESYTINGNTYTTSGTYIDSYQSIHGCDSLVTTVLTVSQEYTVNNPQSICSGDSYTINGNTYTAEGTYTDVLSSIHGCDSTVNTIITFIIPQFDLGITQTGSVLSADQSTGTYQWINCNNGNQPISGAISQNYTVAANGSYAVILSECGESDTTDCFVVDDLGITSEELDQLIQVYPNPVREQLTISSDLEIRSVSIKDLNGREIVQFVCADLKLTVNVADLSEGVYLIECYTTKGKTVKKVIVNE